MELFKVQKEVTKKQSLLDLKGHIKEEGWARRPIWRYRRSMVKASKIRIKEWDYYATFSHQHQIALCATFSDLGYAALFAIAFIDFKAGKVAQIDAIKPFSFGKMGLVANSGDHTVGWANKNLRIAFSRRGERRRLFIGSPDLVLPNGEVGLQADLIVHQSPTLESLNIATSWKQKRKAFYLNEKMSCMPTEGKVTLGSKEIKLSDDESSTVLDWGRGNWTYKNRWYWATASGFVDNVPIGLNFGYGFSDRSSATENAIIYKNKVHKLDEVTLQQGSTYTDKWEVFDNQNRVNLVFTPSVDRIGYFNFLIIKSDQHQVFGSYSGTVVLDDGEIVKIENLLGFAEVVYNRW